MGLWKNGAEQILAVAGMQNQETERKILARQISTKVRRGAMCSSSRVPEKGDIMVTGSFYVEREKGQHKTETEFQWALPGATWCKKKGQGNYVTTVL